MTKANALPIGVFDSGVGGLTVLRALRQRLPNEQFIYLGDTARLPYGTKSGDSVLRYSIQAAEFLVNQGIKYLVIACNTASSVAVEPLRERFAPMPVIGVIEPGSIAGCAASKSGHIAVLATEGTVRGGAYQRAIARLEPNAQVSAQACSLFVALAEEGWTDGAIAEAIAHRYVDELFRNDSQIDTLLLGCTHFPVLAAALRAVIGPAITIVDSAETTARAVQAELIDRGLLNTAGPVLGRMPECRGRTDAQDRPSAPILQATDSPERFARVGSRFLGESFDASRVELVDLAPTAAR
ncbi:glutamate racemase [Steroidobacter agaridevorans]|uniref:Glutamate racemase n=1 Tax=Steroidobacter agaridevorans TaxID=2695856 RepID=A0A829YLM5_9GAMM|nr:glutamate racemase [Steroidobacter agaridevorans]GFE83732.1 glutamate racemase [Steroidobacter agaridevorans]GFE91680.1 glutamate racemase [Steroidobacter agaridevorans]